MLMAAAGTILAVVAGVGVAQEEYFFVGLLTVGLLWLLCEWAGGPLPDAWIMAVLLAGYLVGSRGFAQFLLLSNFPLLPAEAGLLVCVPVLVLRMAFKQTAALRRDGLNLAILGWILLGAARLPLDLREYGWVALRDFAMVYYASFFFIAQALCRHEASRRLLQSALVLAFVLLPVVNIAFSVAPQFFLTMLTWRGVPLVFQKDDLAAAFLASGVFYLWAWREAGGHRAWLIPAAASLLLSATVSSPRAAMVGITMVTAMWLLARRVKLLAFQLGVIAVVLLVTLPFLSFLNKDLKETPVYSAYEHAISIFDYNGTGTYLHTDSGDPSDNNRFRRVWWRSVADETMERSPFFGLGFGADLAARFLTNYDLVGAEEFTARSPHSVIMTVFGRMGTLGLLLFLTIAAMLARSTTLAFRRRDFAAMGLWSVVWVLWFSACFGVVLEGPMGAVVFWTVLGMAHAASATEQEQPAAEAAASRAPTAADSPAAPLPNARAAV
jgi:O-Antigen ligase